MWFREESVTEPGSGWDLGAPRHVSGGTAKWTSWNPAADTTWSPRAAASACGSPSCDSSLSGAHSMGLFPIVPSAHDSLAHRPFPAGDARSSCARSRCLRRPLLDECAGWHPLFGPLLPEVPVSAASCFAPPGLSSPGRRCGSATRRRWPETVPALAPGWSSRPGSRELTGTP